MRKGSLLLLAWMVAGCAGRGQSAVVTVPSASGARSTSHVLQCPTIGTRKDQAVAAAADAPSCNGDDVRACERACEAGSSDACVRRGNALALASQEPNRQLVLYRRACELGNASGCTNLGASLRAHGPGSSGLSVACAGVLFTAACDANDAWGCAMLGEIYADGEGVLPDAKLARSAYEKACFRSDLPGDMGEACAAFADDLRKGRLGPADRATIARAVDAACRAGDRDACNALR